MFRICKHFGVAGISFLSHHALKLFAFDGRESHALLRITTIANWIEILGDGFIVKEQIYLPF